MKNNVIHLTLIIWISYVFTAMIQYLVNSLVNHLLMLKDIIVVLMLFGWEEIYIFDYGIRALKELRNQEIDEEKIRDYRMLWIVLIVICLLVGFGVLWSVQKKYKFEVVMVVNLMKNFC